jgi:hypothetical protein
MSGPSVRLHISSGWKSVIFDLEVRDHVGFHCIKL